MHALFQAIEKPFIRAKKRAAHRIRERCVLNAPFYSKYPYRSEVSILDANPRGAISLDKGFFYNRVPKSANTTVCVALSKAIGLPAQTVTIAKSSFTRPSELSRRDLAQFEDFFKFTFVRNPYTRILSSYLSKITTGLKAHYLRGNDTRPSFSEFCEYLDSEGLYMNAHWAPQTSLMLIPINRFDFIGKVETFDRGWSFVASNLALENRREPTDRFNQLNSERTIEKHYDDKCREIVKRLYRSDFECFGYNM